MCSSDLAFTLIGVVIAGFVMPSFSLEILGLIGVAVESGQEFEPAITDHSVYTIVRMLFDQARFLNTIGDYIGLTVLCCLFAGTVLIIPILQCIFLVMQWFIPLTTEKRRRLSIVNEILQAWQYIEVYLISLFVASW